MEKKLAGWGFIFEAATGRLVSRAEIVESPLPSGLSMVERATDIASDSEQWDEATRRVVPFTNSDKAEQLVATADALIARAQTIDPTIKGRG